MRCKHVVLKVRLERRHERTLATQELIGSFVFTLDVVLFTRNINIQ